MSGKLAKAHRSGGFMTPASERWREQVRAHHAQTERARESADEVDYWGGGIAAQFRDDPSREGDPVLNRLLRWLDAETTVLDVGGGAGRFALPLAKRCREVTVVEPSAAMVEQLKAGVAEAGVENLTIVQENWEMAVVESADVVLCAHVVYGIDDIEPFLERLSESAKERVVIVSHTASPISVAGPFWKAVHGEERINLPALPELVPVLWEMSVFPDIEMVEVSRGRELPDRETALMWLRRMTWVTAGTEKDAALQKTIESVYDEEEDAYVLRNQRSIQGIVTWVTEQALG
jgi:SAM-dependent methyltransferase